MRRYTVHLRSGAAPVVAREGFSWGALFFGPFWLAGQGAWIAAGLLLLVWVALLALATGVVAPVLAVALCAAAGTGRAGFAALGSGAARLHPGACGGRARRADGLGAAAGGAAGSGGAGGGQGRMTMRVAVVDYGSGNLASASRALAVAAERAGIAAEVALTTDPERVRAADRIVLPGQGAFADCAGGLRAVAGMEAAIESATAHGVPFLGICVGMQLMAERGLEHRVTRGLGWIPGDVAEMPAEGLRLPQMGWNGLEFTPGAHPLLDGVQPGDHAYFVHSYALQGGDAADVIATADYGGPRVAMVARGCRAGTQFHVEKSQEVGLRILGNFLRWSPGR